jgi:hypothetical protein
MPLPTGGTWPPTPPPVRAAHSAWSAWYSGDPDRLSAVYGGTGSGFYGNPTAAQFFRPAQYRGGLSGALARFWWGRPTPASEDRAKLHVPVASDLAVMSADLLFSDPPTLTADDTATQGRLDAYAEDGLWSTLREAAEVCAALGGVFLRVAWDREVSERPWLSPVDADAAVPEWRWGKLAAVTFWRILVEDGDTVVRHLERHEPGAILHGVYVGTRDELGRRVPLTDFPETAPVAEVLTDGDTIETGVPTLTAVYIPNVRPNRVWRDLPAAAHLGRSDFSGIEPALDALDEAWSSWMRDLRLAKARLIVPETALESLGRGQGAAFDPDREVFTGLDLDPDGGGGITATQFAIRVDEHERTCHALVEQAVRGAGYSLQTFSANGDTAAITATEVAARERRSLTTRGRKIGYVAPALADALHVLLAVDRVMFGAAVEPERPTVEFPAAVKTDQRTVAETLNLLAQAGAVSTETKVRLAHPDWDDERVAAEVEAISDGVAQLGAAAEAIVKLGQAASLGIIDDSTAQALVEAMTGLRPDVDVKPPAPPVPPVGEDQDENDAEDQVDDGDDT